VHTRGGEVGIRWDGEGRPVFLTGAAETVFEGEIDLQDEIAPVAQHDIAAA
jgi:diaminopimelate epimerase